MGLATLELILVLRRTAPLVPCALVAVVVATASSALFDLDEHGIAVGGEIPAGPPRLTWPDVNGGDLGQLLPVALGIALVGHTDNILTSRSIATRPRYHVDANQELVGLGAINVAAGLAEGYPISSIASRAAVPASPGSKTQPWESSQPRSSGRRCCYCVRCWPESPNLRWRPKSPLPPSPLSTSPGSCGSAV
jgi:MFS superfamily sulfate permease-like transporter